MNVRRVVFLVPLCLCVFVFSSPAHGQGPDSSWPQFRGPESNPAGTNPRLPKSWSKTENVEWSAEIPGRGWSSPIVNGDEVFLTTVTTEGKSKEPQIGTEFSNDFVDELTKEGLSEAEVLERVTARDNELPHEVALHYWLYCLDIKTGSVTWKQEMYSGRPPGGRHRKNSFVSETPVTDGAMVYVYAGNLGIYAYDLDGKQVWKTSLEAHPIYLDFGTGGSAALHANLLLILNDNEGQQFIASFDKKTGRQVWRTDRNLGEPNGPARSGWTTPYVWSHKLRTEIVTYVFTAGDTFKLVRVNSLDEMAQATPAIAGDRLLIRTASRLYSMRMGN
jgi:outer membrane protein assembly factor BamB